MIEDPTADLDDTVRQSHKPDCGVLKGGGSKEEGYLRHRPNKTPFFEGSLCFLNRLYIKNLEKWWLWVSKVWILYWSPILGCSGDLANRLGNGHSGASYGLLCGLMGDTSWTY